MCNVAQTKMFKLVGFMVDGFGLPKGTDNQTIPALNRTLVFIRTRKTKNVRIVCKEGFDC